MRFFEKLFGAGAQPKIGEKPQLAEESLEGNKEKTPYLKTPEEEILESREKKSSNELDGSQHANTVFLLN